jgi:PPM family protein phosphatase
MLESFGATDPGCVRRNNEDYYLLSPKTGLYIVADGMGGAQAGEHASQMAVETVADFVEKSARADAQTLAQAFQAANHRVMNAAATDANLEGMGTTLVAALECGPEVVIASVGDSRAYMYEGGELTGITEDQTWVQEVGRRLGMDESSLRTHPMRHVLTMAIGVSPELRVHSYTLKPQPGAILLLSSDGLHGVVSADHITDTLAGNGSLESKARGLIEEAKQLGGPDNITVVLLKAQ